MKVALQGRGGAVTFEYNFKRYEVPETLRTWVLVHGRNNKCGDLGEPVGPYNMDDQKQLDAINVMKNSFAKCGFKLDVTKLFKNKTVLTITFENDADEAEFIMKMS